MPGDPVAPTKSPARLVFRAGDGIPAKPRGRSAEDGPRTRRPKGREPAMSNLLEFPLPDRPITESEIAELHSRAFRDLEGGICDCATMAHIAAQIVTNEAGIDE